MQAVFVSETTTLPNGCIPHSKYPVHFPQCVLAEEKYHGPARVTLGQDVLYIAAPMTELLKREIPFEWSRMCRQLPCLQALQSLKSACTSAPVFRIPDPSGSFDMSTDASNVGIDAELTQNGKPAGHGCVAPQRENSRGS